MGASQSIAALGLVFGPMAAGPLYDYVGWSWPFWSASAFMAAAFVIVALLHVGKEGGGPEPLIAVEAGAV